MRRCLLLLLPSLSSTLGLTWSLSSSSPLRVVAIGIVSGGVNDVVSGCLPVVALMTTAAVIIDGGGGGRCGWRLTSSVVV